MTQRTLEGLLHYFACVVKLARQIVDVVSSVEADLVCEGEEGNFF